MRSLSAKRVLDLTGGLLLLLLLAPVLATAYAAVAVTSPGGAILRQPRAGLHGRPFPLLKFRTTYTGAPEGRVGPPVRRGTADSPFALRRTPRVTPVGRVLRRLSLDDLPQLVNVVRGEMSLVGPRPLAVGETGRTGPELARLKVRPGLTGPWQVGARSGLPWDEMVLVDLEYVDTHCLAVDLSVLARTVPAALTSRAGARREPARTGSMSSPGAR
jgi:lipopolysaccharide/colanic/teichoic acid biosynthesis glycosyltransferase